MESFSRVITHKTIKRRLFIDFYFFGENDVPLSHTVNKGRAILCHLMKMQAPWALRKSIMASVE